MTIKWKGQDQNQGPMTQSMLLLTIMQWCYHKKTYNKEIVKISQLQVYLVQELLANFQMLALKDSSTSTSFENKPFMMLWFIYLFKTF